ncbi:helix-turn-helix domain-containing protein [bacterium]|nr:helix-turn-helix domain-containing protein [bacterium]
MDAQSSFWHISAMAADQIPTWQLYGDARALPDVLHVERIVDRAAGLDWTIAPHRHLHLHQVFLLCSGEINLQLDGTARKIAPPAVINVPRGTVHGFTFSAGTEGFVLTLPADDFPDLFGAMAEASASLGRPFIAGGDGMEDRFQTLFAHHAESQPFRRTLLRAEATALVAALLAQAPEVQPHRRIDPRIKAFEDLARRSLHEARSLEDFASALSMSPRHLSRLCKAETGLSAKAYVEALKMREACRLLVYTRMSAQQVAYHLGFDDPSYFGRVFQRNLQFSPAAYRKRFET